MGLASGDSNQMSLGHCTVPVTITLGCPDPAATGTGEVGGGQTHSKAVAQPLGLGLG